MSNKFQLKLARASGPDYGVGIVGNMPIAYEGPTKDGYKIF